MAIITSHQKEKEKAIDKEITINAVQQKNVGNKQKILLISGKNAFDVSLVVLIRRNAVDMAYLE